MFNGSLTTKLRPLRLAFIVPADDRDAVRQAIRICSFLWGGTFNPIIPLYKKRPAPTDWRGSVTPVQLLHGYLEAFDPDFIVRLGAARSADLAVGHREEIVPEEILKGVLEDETPRYGIGLYEILDTLLREEYRFLEREPSNFHVPRCDGDLFLASVFGELEDKIHQVVVPLLKLLPNFEEPLCSRLNHQQFLDPANRFLRRLTAYGTKTSRSYSGNDHVLLMDADSISDILLYWNLRALGRGILPVPIDVAGDANVQGFVSEYIERCYWPHRGNRAIFNNATLQKSPSVSDDRLDNFYKSLSLEPVPERSRSKLFIRSWIPRFWDEWDRLHNGAERAEVVVNQERRELGAEPGQFQINSLVPNFAREHGGHGTARCANEIQLRIYGSPDLYAEVIPEGGDEVVRSVDFMGHQEGRCSTNGLVYFPKFKGWDKRLAIPTGESVLKAWFAERGWKIEMSDKGYVAKQLIRQLGGLFGANWLTEESVLRLLTKISQSLPFRMGEMNRLVQEAAKGSGGVTADRLTKWLVSSRVVRLGAELVCPKCRQRSWYSVTEMDYTLKCGHCLEEFPLPSESPKKINWAYRGTGAFSVSSHTHGGLAVILVLHMLSLGMRAEVTPMLSFTAKKDVQEMEVDLAILCKWMRSGNWEHETVFVECKSYGEFEKNDVRRMEQFSRDFPGAVIIFATLRRQLTPREKKLLTPAVNRGRRLWKAARPFTPIVILTGNELFSYHGPRTVWGHLGGKFAALASGFGMHREIVWLADATQQLYLDLEPWEKFLEDRYMRRFVRRKTSG
jgi:hypothetical protein